MRIQIRIQEAKPMRFTDPDPGPDQTFESQQDEGSHKKYF